MDEDLRASYYGATLGVAFDYNLNDQWTLRSKNTASGYFGNFEADVVQAADNRNPNLRSINGFSRSRDDFVIGAKSSHAIMRTMSNGWNFEAVLTIQYLSSTPSMGYGRIGDAPAVGGAFLDKDYVFGGGLTAGFSKEF